MVSKFTVLKAVRFDLHAMLVSISTCELPETIEIADAHACGDCCGSRETSGHPLNEKLGMDHLETI
jgi:hypothetical protein